METLFRSQMMNILNLFLTNRGSSFHLRELIKKTNMSSYSVSRYVDELVKQEVLLEKKERNLRILKLNYSNPIVIGVATYYCEQKLSLLPQKVQHAITEFSQMFDNQFIALFGSYAKDNADANSDIDIFVFANKMITKSPDTSQINHKYMVRINPVFSTEIQTIAQQHVMQTAIPITNHARFFKEYGNAN